MTEVLPHISDRTEVDPAGGDAARDHPDDRRPRPAARTLALAFGLAYLPFTTLGYGTDVDITNLLRSGESLLEGDYRYSRPPGALPYEALVGVLSRLGGPLLVNLASAAMATTLLVALAHLVTAELGPRSARIAVVVLGTQPWFWVAATSLGDYVFALGFLVVGVDLARRDARLGAGLAFATAIGFRSGTVLLVGAYLLAEITGVRNRRRPWSDVARTAAVTVAVGALWFIPPWLAAERTSRFLMNEFETTGLVAMIGRWGIKNIAFFGVFTLVVVVLRAPVLLGGLRRVRDEPLVRFAVIAALVSEALFLRFPWKPVHLLPTAVALAVVLAASPRARNGTVALVVASQILLGLVSVTVARPDVAEASTTGELQIGLTRGVVVNDVACRLDPPYAGDWPDLSTPAADYAAIDVLTCQARSWRADPRP